MSYEYVQRKFPLGHAEWVQCWCRMATRNGTTMVVFKDDRGELFKGALTARFEYIANLFRVELLMRGLTGPVRFFHERPAWSNGVASFGALVKEVKVSERNGQYCFATWLPVSPDDMWLFTEAVTSTESTK